MQSGSTVHRSPSAEAALELLTMISTGGGLVERIVVTRTGAQISVVELRQAAEQEARRSGKGPVRMRLFSRLLGNLRSHIATGHR